MIKIEYVRDCFQGQFIVTIDKIKMNHPVLSIMRENLIKEINREFDIALENEIKNNVKNVDDVFDYYDEI